LPLRAGLYAGWELVFRHAATAADWKYKIEFKNTPNISLDLQLADVTTSTNLYKT